MGGHKIKLTIILVAIDQKGVITKYRVFNSTGFNSGQSLSVAK